MNCDQQNTAERETGQSGCSALRLPPLRLLGPSGGGRVLVLVLVLTLAAKQPLCGVPVTLFLRHPAVSAPACRFSSFSLAADTQTRGNAQLYGGATSTPLSSSRTRRGARCATGRHILAESSGDLALESLGFMRLPGPGPAEDRRRR